MRISVISINRNNRDGLERTMNSVFDQTFTDYEYLIIDGASTDRSAELIRSHADRLAYWVSEKDTGIYNAINKGIRQSRGEYLLFLNSGDFLCDRTILQSVADQGFAEDVIFGDLRYEDEDTPLCLPDTVSLNTFLGTSIGHGASLIRRTLFDRYGLYNENNKIVSDWEFFIEVFIRHHCTYRHVKRVFTVYQPGGLSVSRTHQEAQAEERRAALKRIFPEFYDLIMENQALKGKLASYEQSRIMRFLRQLQNSRINKIKNKYLHPPGK
jgi:glycosyltransferase involved in cell wall biosynthesis